jgi:acyl dehydratase
MLYFEDFKIGDIIKLGEYSVTEQAIIDFAKEFDPQYFHIDPVAAKKSGFKGLVSSGWMTASICMRLMCDAFILNTVNLGSPGSESMSWPNPVRPGDTLSGTVEVIESLKSSKGKPQGRVKYDVKIYNQNKQIVMTLITTGIYVFREQETIEIYQS